MRIGSEGALLKVTRPQGRGPRATEIMAFEKLSLRGVANFDSSLVSRVVKHADGEYIRVADIQYNPFHDATVSMDITDGEMKADRRHQRARARGRRHLRGLPALIPTVKRRRATASSEDVLADIDASPRYGRPIVVAEGTKAPRRGGCACRATTSMWNGTRSR